MQALGTLELVKLYYRREDDTHDFRLKLLGPGETFRETVKELEGGNEALVIERFAAWMRGEQTVKIGLEKVIEYVAAHKDATFDYE